MQVKFVVSSNEHVMLTLEITVILFTQGLPDVHCTKNRPMCENYIGNYKMTLLIIKFSRSIN